MPGRPPHKSQWIDAEPIGSSRGAWASHELEKMDSAFAAAMKAAIEAGGRPPGGGHQAPTPWISAARLETPSAPFHSITSSARMSRAVGTVRPSDLAVLRLMMSSIFVACWTGRSAGLSPLSTRPV